MTARKVRAEYTQEFKLEAVRQVRGGQSQQKVAQALGIPKNRSRPQHHGRDGYGRWDGNAFGRRLLIKHQTQRRISPSAAKVASWPAVISEPRTRMELSAPAPWARMLTLPPALTVLPRALSLVCAVLLWLLLEPRLMEMEAALVGSPPASAWAAPDKRCALPSTLLTFEHRSANDPVQTLSNMGRAAAM